ncbi:hypothetical protein BXY51_002416 [Actinoplanes cyaneus]|nr:hypothetical protein [Actinoplanes cyaneus]
MSRRHLIAIPRARPAARPAGAGAVADVLMTIPGPGAGVRMTIPLAVGERPRRDSHAVLAVVLSLTALAVLCCGAMVTLMQLAGVDGRR